MTAADAREQLEAVIRSQFTAINRPGRGRVTHNEAVRHVLAAADKYATSLAAEELDRIAGRERLEQATAERTGRAS